MVGSMMSNPMFGSLFDLLMSAYGQSGSGAGSGFGERPSNVEGPSMAGGGFYSQPQGAMGLLSSGSSQGGGIGSTVGSIGGGAVGTYFGGPIGGMIGSKLGSMAGSMLTGGGKQPPPMSAPPPPAKKPISRVNPSDQFQIQQAIGSLPPELRQSFSQSMGLY